MIKDYKIRLLKTHLNSPSRFKKYMQSYIEVIKEKLHEYNIDLDSNEISDLLLSICRANDFNVIFYQDNKIFLDKNKVQKWIGDKLVPNTIIVKLDDPDAVRLLIFCIEITYQMFSGGTKATVTQKGFRERRRSFESILADQFIGKLGEIFTKKFLENNFKAKVMLDWEISPNIEQFRNDIINAVKKVSIKTSPTLAGIWAEADKGYDYGIMVKCSVPKQPILQFFIEVCGFKKLLDFADLKIPPEDKIFKQYIEHIRNRIINFKCEEIKTSLKGFICGYFKTSKKLLVKEGKKLKYLGVVREERYLIPINKLKWQKKDWLKFIEDVNIP